jgi:hypothetical protein
MPKLPSRAGEIASTAADAGGNLASVGFGALFAGSEGAVAGAVVGPSVALVFKQAVAQIGSWVGGRQAERVSEAIRVAAFDIEQHVSEGGAIRSGFADAGDQSLLDAEEIAEGVLQTVAFSYEQRKAPYLGHLLASLAVRPEITVADAHRLTRLVDLLSYRQLACLAAMGSGEAQIDLIKANVAIAYSKQQAMSDGIAEETEELSNEYELLGFRDSTAEGLVATGSGIKLGHRSLPRDLALTERGYFLYAMTRLDLLPKEDRLAAIMELVGSDVSPQERKN